MWGIIAAEKPSANTMGIDISFWIGPLMLPLIDSISEDSKPNAASPLFKNNEFIIISLYPSAAIRR